MQLAVMPRKHLSRMSVVRPALQVEHGVLPAPLLPGMLDFYNNYKTAVLSSGSPGADERRVASIMGAIADRHALALRQPLSTAAHLQSNGLCCGTYHA